MISLILALAEVSHMILDITAIYSISFVFIDHLNVAVLSLKE